MTARKRLSEIEEDPRRNPPPRRKMEIDLYLSEKHVTKLQKIAERRSGNGSYAWGRIVADVLIQFLEEHPEIG